MRRQSQIRLQPLTRSNSQTYFIDIDHTNTVRLAARASTLNYPLEAVLGTASSDVRVCGLRIETTKDVSCVATVAL